MSLVNDMLRDLNRRTPVSNRAARVHGAIQSSIESKRPRVRMGLILAGGLLAGLGAGYFYFQSMGVQVVQVPLAVVPAQTQPTPPAIQNVSPAAQPASGPSARVEPATLSVAATDAPAVETLVEIRELAVQPNGFTLLLEASQQTTFDILDRSAFGLTLHIDGVDRFDRAATTVPGMSLLLVSDGLDVGLELEAPADFLVREDTETPAFDILITASYRPQPELTAIDASTSRPAPPAEAPVAAAPSIAATNPDAAPSASAAPAGERSNPVRVNRELSLEERDRNNSQEALRLVQGGAMVEAYQKLSDFLEENPSGHQSRETLATLLFAQQEYAQAGVVVDQGLSQVPNYGPYKKIKARLLIQANAPAQALALLRDIPPSVATDTEYHELLASLYRDAGQHPQAVNTYQELLRVDRTQGRWWMGLGISLEAQDMDSDALASYQAALQTGNLDANLREFVQNRVSNLGSQP